MDILDEYVTTVNVLLQYLYEIVILEHRLWFCGSYESRCKNKYQKDVQTDCFSYFVFETRKVMVLKDLNVVFFSIWRDLERVIRLGMQWFDDNNMGTHFLWSVIGCSKDKPVLVGFCIFVQYYRCCLKIAVRLEFFVDSKSLVLYE